MTMEEAEGSSCTHCFLPMMTGGGRESGRAHCSDGTLVQFKVSQASWIAPSLPSSKYGISFLRPQALNSALDFFGVS